MRQEPHLAPRPANHVPLTPVEFLAGPRPLGRTRDALTKAGLHAAGPGAINLRDYGRPGSARTERAFDAIARLSDFSSTWCRIIAPGVTP